MNDRERQIEALMGVRIDEEAPLHFPVRPHWIPISGSLSREAAEKVLDALAALPSEPGDEEAFNEEPILRDPEHRLSRGSWRRSRSPSEPGARERQIEGAKQAALRVAQQHWTLADMEDLEAIFEAYERELDSAALPSSSVDRHTLEALRTPLAAARDCVVELARGSGDRHDALACLQQAQEMIDQALGGEGGSENADEVERLRQELEDCRAAHERRNHTILPTSINPSVLARHYLADIVCDHEQKADNPVCSCSLVHLGWHSSVGEAVAAWIGHVVEQSEAAGKGSQANG